MLKYQVTSHCQYGASTEDFDTLPEAITHCNCAKGETGEDEFEINLVTVDAETGESSEPITTWSVRYHTTRSVVQTYTSKS